MAKFRRNTDEKAEEKVEEAVIYADINLDALDEEFQLDQDADLVAQYDEEDTNDNEPINKSVVEKSEIFESTNDTENITDVVEKTEKKEEEKIVENAGITLKEKLSLLNDMNTKTKKIVEDALLKSAMCENATSTCLMVPQKSFVYIEKWLKEQELKVTMGHPKDENTIEICVDWS